MTTVRDVRSVLYATAILFAVAIVGIRGLFLWLEYRNAIDRAEASTRDLALLVEENTKRALETSDLLLREIVVYVQSKGGVEAAADSSDIHDFLASLTERSATSDQFLIVDSHGFPVATSSNPAPMRTSFADVAWFLSLRDGAETYIGDPFVRGKGEEMLYTYNRRIDDANGTFAGVAHVILKPTILQTISRPDAGADNLILGLWGRDGRIIARTGLTPEQLNFSLAQSRILNAMASEKSGTFRSDVTADQVERIVSFRRLEQWPVIVTASIPLATALSSWTGGFYWSTALAAVVLAAFGGLTTIGARLSYRVEETQNQLQKANDDLAQANTDLEKALADKVVLLQEIHHRVKNNLQVTSSLLQMQSRRFTDPTVKAAFRETQDRLRSIGLIHDTLYRRETGGMVDLQEYLDRLINELSATYGAADRGISVELNAEPISIGLERAAPLALAMTEAISNAFKHAFEPGRGGRIVISAVRIDDQIEVSVRDTGKGVSDVRETDSSLGMRLIRAFADQLGGSFSIEAKDGTIFRLRIPA
ncbi:sensor histidine kinase [Microvirga alba]|uniref:histidine kinase n=1 Tax=Microvirga alba TaxID=2791025 RepID=A0A931FPN4_9HYPH|nr:histidine kinase dimerization/phosphoacceptor domain -containing protein [Microvirga alba]MBF9233677.1 ATP-binding protein [Microvirga alba]